MSAVEYEPVIGLEIHVQLATATKMFCGCELSFGEPPNTRTCPVCLGLPGSLPVANAQAVHFGLMIGLALGCELAPRSIFHRKNYFYPDLPKGYQISQYDEPLCGGGRLGEVRIHRVHLEEDAAKLVHVGASGRIHGSDASIVDFNRGGTPLAEIVTEPDLRSGEQAREWLQLLRTTLRQLGVSDVNMEEGSLRCDANISLRPAGSMELGTKTELKNMNSFRFIERGIRAELARQEKLLRAGGKVVQETLHFDPASERITSLRSKEEAHDYRYFPEPDLLPVAIEEAMLERARAAMPELPAERALRLERELGLSDDSRAPAGLPRGAGRLLRGRPRRQRGSRAARAGARQLGARRPRRTPRRWREGSGGDLDIACAAGCIGCARGAGGGQAHQRRRRPTGARSARGRRRRPARDRRRLRVSRRWTMARTSRRSSRLRWPPTPMRPSGSREVTPRRSARSWVM